ncbi:hypothetical protein BC830DRAFT_867868 [Chytriomyces sp. MP71]|nr:hypothetical protein BC830DRAFT_867868 [Chytriomyces sp. MP71]
MLNFTPSLTHWKKLTPDSPDIQGVSSKGATVSDTSKFTDHDVALKHLIDSYKQLLFDHYEFPDIYMVQSLLIVVLTGGCGRGARATGVYGYMGMAVRMSHELGLHRSIQQLGVNHRQLNREALALRNRTWHSVMILETYTGIWTGRPLAIHDNDWDAEYPEVTSSEVETLVHHIELAQIIARILRFANRARSLNTEEFVENITASLKTWWNGLDEDWRALKFSERWNSKALMALMYNAAVILFHRMAFHRIDQPDCLESAAAITKLVSRFEKPPSDNECVALFPTFTYAAMLACSIHIDQMLAYGGEGMGESVHRLVSAIGCLEKCMRVFDTLRSVFVDAERCWKTVLDFLSMKGIRLDELVNAAKSGSAIAAAVSGMGALARGGPEAELTYTGATPMTSRAVAPLSATTQEVHPLMGGDSTSIANWPTGFLHEALLRNELLKTNNSLPSHFNALSHHLRLGSTDSLSASPTANMGILNGGDSGFIWDGLSLFDLAGLGGIGMGQPPNLQQFNLQQGALAQQQSLSHQQYQQLLPQQQLSRSTPQAPIFPSSNLLQPRPLQMQPVQQQFLRTAQPQADTNFPNAYTQQKPTQRQLQPPLQLQRHPVPNQPQLLFTPGSQIKSELLGFSNDALNGSIAGNTMNTLGQVSTCDYVPPPSFGAGTGAFIRQ